MPCSPLRSVLALGVTAALSAALPASAAGAISVTVDGRSVKLAQSPIVRSGRLFVPLRGVFEDVGASVVYESNGQISAKGNGHDVFLNVGSRQAFVDGRSEMLEAAPFIVGSSVYVPLRFVTEALGALVNYDRSNQLVAISTGEPGTSNQSLASPSGAATPPSPTAPAPRTPSPSPQSVAAATAPPSPTAPAPAPSPSSQSVASAAAAPSTPTAPPPTLPPPSPRRVASAATAPPSPTAPPPTLPPPSPRRVASTATAPPTPSAPPPRSRRRAGSFVRVVREHPANGRSVRSSRPTVEASFVGGNVDANSVRVAFDGRDVTAAAYVSPHGITYTPLSPIPAGSHDVRVQGADRSGATFTKRWLFRSGSKAPVVTITSVAPQPGGTVGREFTVRGRTRPGATVTIQVRQDSPRRGFFQRLGGLLGIVRPASAQSTVTAGPNGSFASLIDISAPRGARLGIVITSTDPDYGAGATPLRFSVRMH